jgi:hypothetical protein
MQEHIDNRGVLIFLLHVDPWDFHCDSWAQLCLLHINTFSLLLFKAMVWLWLHVSFPRFMCWFGHQRGSGTLRGWVFCEGLSHWVCAHGRRVSGEDCYKRSKPGPTHFLCSWWEVTCSNKVPLLCAPWGDVSKGRPSLSLHYAIWTLNLQDHELTKPLSHTVSLSQVVIMVAKAGKTLSVQDSIPGTDILNR